MLKLAEVRTLYETNVRSIPALFRQAADSIENEDDEPKAAKTTAVVLIQLADNGCVQIYAWGNTDDMHALAMIERGKEELLSIWRTEE